MSCRAGRCGKRQQPLLGRSVVEVAVRLISLKDVPDEEVEELRDLLRINHISYYETTGGNWGISVPAIWLHHNEQLQQARSLIDQYQAERFARARGEYEALKREGKNRTIIDVIREDPGRFIAYLVVAGVIIYLSIKPFLDIGK